eukprot:2299135-Pyramimonas_sp.AAC.1
MRGNGQSLRGTMKRQWCWAYADMAMRKAVSLAKRSSPTSSPKWNHNVPNSVSEPGRVTRSNSFPCT